MSKFYRKKYVIDVTQEKARSNVIHIAHNIPIDGTVNIVQSKSSRSRVSIALNAARGCKINVEINEADRCSLEINLNGGQQNEVDVVMNNVRNSKLVITFSNPTETTTKVHMDSPKQSTVEIRQDHGFNSSVVAGITNALGSKFTINQLNPKASSLDVCIQEGSNDNVINIDQVRPIQSTLTRSSTGCKVNENGGSTPNIDSDSKPPIDDPNINPIDTNEQATSQSPPTLITLEPVKTTSTTTVPSTVSADPDTGSNDNDGSQSAVYFNDPDTQPAEDEQNLSPLVDIGEDEDYYYYYDFNNDENLNVEDFPDYEDYQDGIGTRNKERGKCIRVLKKEAKGKEWVRKIGPLWRSLAQQIGVRRCKTANRIAERNDAIRFGV